MPYDDPPEGHEMSLGGPSSELLFTSMVPEVARHQLNWINFLRFRALERVPKDKFNFLG